jgi:hypothetical protein
VPVEQVCDADKQLPQLDRLAHMCLESGLHCSLFIRGSVGYRFATASAR